MVNASIIVALIALIGAVGLHFANLRQATLERKRRACAEALADALKWLEIPYRVRRRRPEGSSSVSELITLTHALQERLLFHESWLRIEIPGLAAEYVQLVSAVKGSAQDAIQEAWKVPQAEEPNMNIGKLGVLPVDTEVMLFINSVREQLSWWSF